jgi:hypothetical protein
MYAILNLEVGEIIFSNNGKDTFINKIILLKLIPKIFIITNFGRFCAIFFGEADNLKYGRKGKTP